MDDYCETFVADCRVRLATDLLTHTWDPVVLMALRSGPRRRMDLLSDIGGISDKVLSQSLNRLTSHGLVGRVHNSSTRVVSYELRPLGVSFAEGPMAALGRWAVDNGDELLASHQ